MSDHCPFQSRFPKINEARCTIVMNLKPYELQPPYTPADRTGSFFCSFYKNEIKCPVIVDIIKWLQDLKCASEIEGDNPAFRIGTGCLQDLKEFLK